jgi:hypothetical protein
VRQALSNLSAGWFERAGRPLPRKDNGDAAIPVEISPLFALDAGELAQRLPTSWRLQGESVLLED